jgi:predicted nucleic acid-binding protein
MTVCIDTNVLVQARSASSPFHCILAACAAGRFSWAVSSRIYLEYREVITDLSGTDAWNRVVSLLELMDLSGDLLRVSPAYQFRIIGDDPDDNAFTDCAITAHADYIITSDRHFAPLANAGYKPQPITPEEFIRRYRGVYV